MSTAAFASYFGAALGAILLLLHVFRPRSSLAHWAFVAGMAALAAEAAYSGLLERASSEGELLGQQQQRLLILSFLPGFWTLFSITYARGHVPDFLSRRKWLWIAPIALIPMGAYFLRQYFFVITRLNETGTTLALRLGWAGVSVYVLLLVSSVLVVMNLERTFRAAVGTIRWRIKFMLMGVGLIFIVRIYTSSQALLFRGIDERLETLNSLALVVASVLIARSFFRNRQFDVDVYPSQLVLQNSITVFLAGIYLVVVGVLAKVAAYLGGDNEFAIKAFVALISLVALAVLLQSNKVRMRLRRFVSRNFQRPLYDYRTVWRKFTEGTASRVEQADLCRSLVKLVADVFQSLSVAIWLMDEDKESMELAASTFLSDSKPHSLDLTSPEAAALIARFKAQAEPVDIESPATAWAASLREIHPSQFHHGGHRVCMPLISQGEVIGLITLGDRVGGVDFTLQDLDMLKCVGDHASAGLRNVQLSQKMLQGKELEAFQTMATFFVHDLKNAASTLNLMLQNLPVHFDDPAFREDSLRGISKTVAHINRLIGRLSLLRHEQNLKAVESDLNEIVSSALAGLAQGVGPALTRELGATPAVTLDREQIGKVVTNLVLNAAEALSEGGHVRVTTHGEGNWAVLTVADNGCGMSADFIANGLFRPFQTTKKNGLGIGMFQSKMIVEAHGGRISVSSDPGKGTTFQVLLPLSKQTP